MNYKHLGVPEDSKSPTLGVLGFTPTLGQSGVTTPKVKRMKAEGIGARSLVHSTLGVEERVGVPGWDYED